jgi:hypothetical protein
MVNPSNTPETFAAATTRGPLSLARFRHCCANRDCHRAKLWSRWLTRTELVEFGGVEYCCAGCAEEAFEQKIEGYLMRFGQENTRPHRIPLGLLLISRGLLTNVQLQQALDVQRERPGRRLGRLLSEMGVLSEEALVAALGIQWGCPVYPLEKNRAYLDCAGLLPFALLHSSGVLPVHYSTSTGVLHLAFTKRIDHTLLYAAESVLGLRVSPCVASERAVGEALHHICSSLLPQETVFDSICQPREMARMAVNYASKLHASRVSATGMADCVWFRFENSLGAHHLLFQTHVEKSPETFRHSTV